MGEKDWRKGWEERREEGACFAEERVMIEWIDWIEWIGLIGLGRTREFFFFFFFTSHASIALVGDGLLKSTRYSTYL